MVGFGGNINPAKPCRLMLNLFNMPQRMLSVSDHPRIFASQQLRLLASHGPWLIKGNQNTAFFIPTVRLIWKFPNIFFHKTSGQNTIFI